MRDRCFEAESNHSKVNDDLLRRVHACSRDVEDTRRERDEIVESIRNIVRGSGVFVRDKEMFERELVKDPRKIVDEVVCKIKGLERENLDLRAQLENMSYLSGMMTTYEESRREVDRLREENVAFSRVIAELSESNDKLRRDRAMLNNTLSRMSEPGRKTNVTVDRQEQEQVIGTLGDKMCRGYVFPMDELQLKIEGLRQRVNTETNFDKKNDLLEEIADYERRMTDFLLLLDEEATG